MARLWLKSVECDIYQLSGLHRLAGTDRREITMSTVSTKPAPPEDYECCESGCSPCVWDTYYEDLKDWQEQQKQSAAEAEQGV